MKNPFRTPTAQEAALEELHQAELDLLKSQRYLEHYTAEVNMLQTRIARLRHQSAPELNLASVPRKLAVA